MVYSIQTFGSPLACKVFFSTFKIKMTENYKTVKGFLMIKTSKNLQILGKGTSMLLNIVCLPLNVFFWKR